MLPHHMFSYLLLHFSFFNTIVQFSVNVGSKQSIHFPTFYLVNRFCVCYVFLPYLYNLWLLLFYLLLSLCILNCLLNLLYFIFGRLFLCNYSWCLPRFSLFLNYFLLPHSPLWFLYQWCHFLFLAPALVFFSISFSCPWFSFGSSSSCIIGSCWRSSTYFPESH